MSRNIQPTCWIIAGPNGAGKTTFALKYLPQITHCRHFINADLIAAGLSPLAPETATVSASRLFLKTIRHHIRQRDDFAFETTLSGQSHRSLINRMRADGWRVELIFLALPSVEMSKMRVAERVAHGGHDIPTATIERRFPRTLYNLLELFSHQVDRTHCYLNVDGVPVLVFVQTGEQRMIKDEAVFRQLWQESRP
ncbi:MAG: zeta toxin family protein [Magnetococcales bacterium]|nr:zeta toxin family protein [Magnetococcales bacterium]